MTKLSQPKAGHCSGLIAAIATLFLCGSLVAQDVPQPTKSVGTQDAIYMTEVSSGSVTAKVNHETEGTVKMDVVLRIERGDMAQAFDEKAYVQPKHYNKGMVIEVTPVEGEIVDTPSIKIDNLSNNFAGAKAIKAVSASSKNGILAVNIVPQDGLAIVRRPVAGATVVEDDYIKIPLTVTLNTAEYDEISNDNRHGQVMAAIGDLKETMTSQHGTIEGKIDLLPTKKEVGGLVADEFVRRANSAGNAANGVNPAKAHAKKGKGKAKI